MRCPNSHIYLRTKHDVSSTTHHKRNAVTCTIIELYTNLSILVAFVVQVNINHSLNQLYTPFSAKMKIWTPQVTPLVSEFPYLPPPQCITYIHVYLTMQGGYGRGSFIAT